MLDLFEYEDMSSRRRIIVGSCRGADRLQEGVREMTYQDTRGSAAYYCRDSPSLTPAILFGCAGAIYSSIKASKRGLPIARYWVAAAVSTLVAFVVLVSLTAF